jgi:hypothetical protein
MSINFSPKNEPPLAKILKRVKTANILKGSVGEVKDSDEDTNDDDGTDANEDAIEGDADDEIESHALKAASPKLK